MLVSGLLFAIMSVCTRLTSLPGPDRVSVSQVTFLRFAIGALVMLPLLRVPGARLLGDDRRGLVWRGIAGGVAVYLYFLALHNTTVTNAVLLNNTSILFAPLFASLLLGERVSRRVAPAGIASITGILLITRPTSAAANIGDLYGLLSGVTAGAALTAVRRLRRTETTSAVLFYFNVVGMPVAALGLLAEPLAWPTARAWWLIAAIGASSIAAQWLMTYGYRYVRTLEGTLMTLTQVVYASLGGVLVLAEPLSSQTLAGGALVVGSAVWTGLDSGASRRRAPSTSNAPP
ncbi:MAG TPA: DMT family transporter [Chthonomonadales bacterium]|nr:DMT family transporter [Chthonomonadales bacterium]